MKRSRPPSTPAPAGPIAGVPSGTHQALHRPGKDRRVAHALLDHVGLDERGESIEDHLRDRRSKGVRDGYDDSIEHAAPATPKP